MASTKVTDLAAITAAASNDVFYIIDASDTTDDVEGSSKKITLANLQDDLTITESQISDLQSYLLTSSDVDHDATTNFSADEHFTQANITTVGTVTSGTWAATDIAVIHGGTGASDASGAKTNLGFMTDLTDDTTPQLAGNLDASSFDITGVGRFDYDYAEGTVTAAGNLGTSEAIDWSAGSHVTGTLDSDVTITHTNEVSGQKITLALAYDGSAQRTITWSDVDKWEGGSAPTSPSSAGEVLVVTLIYLGTTCYGSGAVFS